MRKTEDELTRECLKSTATVINATGGTNGDNPTEITRADVDAVIKSLVNSDALTVADSMKGTDAFGTAPIRNSFLALASAQLIGDFENITGFVSVAQYPQGADKALRAEWGSVSNLRFLVSSIGSVENNVSANGNSVYNIFCTGIEAYACVEQDQYSSQFIYRPPIYSGALAQNASIAYKFSEVPVITNDAWIAKLRVTASV